MVIFGAGVVTGGLLVRHLDLGALAQSQRPARPNLPVSAGGIRLEFLRRMQRELGLTAEQRERVDKILKESQERTREIMEPVAPDVRAEMQRTRDKFREVLTLEQRARFDELLKRQQHPQKRPAPPRERTNLSPLLTNAP